MMKKLIKILFIHLMAVSIIYIAFTAVVGITGVDKYVRNIVNLEGAYGYLQPLSLIHI